MKFLGLRMVQGFKDYNQAWKRVIVHPTLIFEDDIHYYFINLTSTNEKLRDVLRNYYCKEYVFIGENVWHNNVKQAQIKMNLMVLVARCDKNTVESYDNLPEFPTRIQIKGRYKCSNYDKLVDDCLSKIKMHHNSFFVYNGNDDYQCPDLKSESSLPAKLLQSITDYKKKKPL